MTFVPRAGQSPQVAYVISRRVGNAVVRNRLRRRLQAMVSNRIRLAPTTLSSGLYLITPSPAAVSLPSERLAEALSTALDTSQSRASLSGASR